MYLKQHTRRQACFGQYIWHADHGAFDDVGSGSLNGRVDGLALSKGAPWSFGLDAIEIDFLSLGDGYVAMLLG